MTSRNSWLEGLASAARYGQTTRRKTTREIAEWLVETMSECMETAPDDFYLLARYSDRGFQYWHLQGNGTVYPT